MGDELRVALADEAQKLRQSVAAGQAEISAALQAEANARAQSLEASVSYEVEDLRSHFSKRLEELDDVLREARLEVAEIKLERWNEAGATYAVVPASIKALGLALQVHMSQHYRVSGLLQTILNTIRDGHVPDAVVERNLISALTDVPPEYAISVEAIKDALRAARAK